MPAIFDGPQTLLDQPGKHIHGAACLDITRLATVDEPAVQEMLRNA